MRAVLYWPEVVNTQLFVLTAQKQTAKRELVLKPNTHTTATKKIPVRQNVFPLSLIPKLYNKVTKD